MQDVVNDHQQSLATIREQDPETAQYCLERHIALSRDRLLKGMQGRRD
jgi:DNA-binding FadR family transcriptional regulator